MGGKIYSYISDIDPCDFYHILYFEKKNLLVQLIWLPFVINHSRLIALRSTSYWRGQWISEYIYSTERQYTNLFLRFSVNWPQLLGIFVCTGVNLVASFLIILNLYRRSATFNVHILELIQTEFCLKVNQMLHTATKLLIGENDS